MSVRSTNRTQDGCIPKDDRARAQVLGGRPCELFNRVVETFSPRKSCSSHQRPIETNVNIADGLNASQPPSQIPWSLDKPHDLTSARHSLGDLRLVDIGTASLHLIDLIRPEVGHQLTGCSN